MTTHPYCSRFCSSLCSRICDALKTQLRVLGFLGLACALWLAIYFAGFSEATRSRFKDAVAPLNTDSGVWVGAVIQAIFSVLTPYVLETDDDLPAHGCRRSAPQRTGDTAEQGRPGAQPISNSVVTLVCLEVTLGCGSDDDDNGAAKGGPAPSLSSHEPSKSSVAGFMLFKTAVFTLLLGVLTYYVRWFYQLQDAHFGAVHDERTGNVRWGALVQKMLVDEYVFTPTNVPPLVTLFLFTRLVGRKLFLRQGAGLDGSGEPAAVHSCSAIACSWLVWVVPHYVLVLMTWMPSHLMIYPMPSGVQLPLFMCCAVLSNVLQSYMTMSRGSGGGPAAELRAAGGDSLDFAEWASTQVEQRVFGRRGR